MDPLFQNHLDFMALHRGSVRRVGNDFHIEGPLPELCGFVPGDETSIVPDRCPSVRLAPWSGEVWSTKLSLAGYRQAETLAYMELANPYAPCNGTSASSVSLAENEDGASIFAGVQANGFATGDEDIDEWWASYFRRQALRNYRDTAQSFYLGWNDGEAVSSTLVVRSAGVAGIYAVATKPASRRRGVSAAVLERVRRDCVARDWLRIILQTVKGSYAHTYYQKLGFCLRYESTVWRI
jgi:GNAT superfamily N-acetyltransferase